MRLGIRFSLTLLLLSILACAGYAQNVRVIPQGSEIKVRTDTAIPAKPEIGHIYTADVSNEVVDRSGNVAIPRASRAELVAVQSEDGKDTILDLRSVTVNGRRYLLTATGTTKTSSPEGVGMNKRTAKYVGGGAAIGTVLGALMGGGKGAAIGAIVGGAGGAGTQVLTGKKKEIPAETELTYKTAEELQLQPSNSNPTSGLQNRTPNE